MKSLKVALIGYGRMGRMIECFALERGHEVVLRADATESNLADALRSASADVAIEFTIPSSAYTNCLTCIELGIPVVSGTTAWTEGVEKLRQYCREHPESTFLWSSNYSVGVNLFLEINRKVAQLMRGVNGYQVSMEEIHHIHKLDAPSGTAITLAETLISELPNIDGWLLAETDTTTSASKLPIHSVREGETPGTHTISYRSSVDEIRLTHEAFGREGFALGAVLAAEYASEHKGDLRMSDVVSKMLKE